MNERFVVFDLETTGLCPQRGDRIIEVGAILVENGLAQEEFHSFINHGKAISKTVQRIHGISTEMLIGQPASEEVLTRFKSFISSNVLISHNASFDMKFLRYEFSRLGLCLTNKAICTLKISRKVFPDLLDYRLETVYRCVTGSHFEKIKLHRALDDARLVAKIWMKLKEK